MVVEWMLEFVQMMGIFVVDDVQVTEGENLLHLNQVDQEKFVVVVLRLYQEIFLHFFI